MGRVKKIVSKKKARNLEKIMKRWSRPNNGQNDQSRGNQTAEEGRPSIDCISNPSEEQDSSLHESDTDSNPRPRPSQSLDPSKTSGSKNILKPTSFALYSSYREPIQTSNDGPQYGLVDMRMLTNFLGCFPCKNCYCETTQAKLVDNKTVFANTVVMTCSVCG